MVKTCITCKHSHYGQTLQTFSRQWICLNTARVDLVTGAKLYEKCRDERDYDLGQLKCGKVGRNWEKKT
jgi:hypothetical protein